MITNTPLFVDIILIIAACFAAIGIITILVYESLDQEKVNKKTTDTLITIIALSITLVFSGVIVAVIGKVVSNEHVALSELSDKIHVEGEKVIFDPISEDPSLDNNYASSNVNNEHKPVAKTRTVFISEYDENFDSITLTAQNGYKYKLNYEDTKFLLEKGARK